VHFISRCHHTTTLSAQRPVEQQRQAPHMKSAVDPRSLISMDSCDAIFGAKATGAWSWLTQHYLFAFTTWSGNFLYELYDIKYDGKESLCKIFWENREKYAANFVVSMVITGTMNCNVSLLTALTIPVQSSVELQHRSCVSYHRYRRTNGQSVCYTFHFLHCKEEKRSGIRTFSLCALWITLTYASYNSHPLLYPPPAANTANVISAYCKN